MKGEKVEPEKSVTFSGDELQELIGIVCSFINEGFSVPPYTDEEYAIFEKLGITNEMPYLQYNVERPIKEKDNG